jgi:hypothetical protein
LEGDGGRSVMMMVVVEGLVRGIDRAKRDLGTIRHGSRPTGSQARALETALDE